MPTKRQFDLGVILIILMHCVTAQAKIWATRKSTDPNAGTISKVSADAVQIVS